MSTFEEPLEALAEAIVFAHEADAGVAPAPTDAAFAELERVATLAATAIADRLDPPPTLAARLAADGLAHCARLRERPAGSTADGPRLWTGPGAPGFTTPARRSPTPNWFMFALGAAAASLALWLTVLRDPSIPLEDLRQSVLATDPTAVHQDWQPGPSAQPGAIRGDVVWSQSRQDGWLTFHGLPALDAEHAYQLWIVDGTREGAPVDGGVFVVPGGDDEVLVPIHATLRIGRPAAFVVTVEPKNGVVVSKQEQVVAIASL